MPKGAPDLAGYTQPAMVRILAIVSAGVLGLAFGSFLNVCVTRWPEGESVIKPRSHCRSCDRPLAWWENLPLLSWLALGGRCRTCKAPIGWRYPLVELAVAAFWAYTTWQIFAWAPELQSGVLSLDAAVALTEGIGRMIFFWLLVALAVLDIEHFWLPDRLTLPGIGLGLVLAVTRGTLAAVMLRHGDFGPWEHDAAMAAGTWFLGATIPAGVVLVIRFVYNFFRDQEGIGLGDVKLMAMLGGWIGITGGLLALGIGVLAGLVIVLVSRLLMSQSTQAENWWLTKVPLGTFLCLGGVISCLWRVPIIAAYERLAGF